MQIYHILFLLFILSNLLLAQDCPSDTKLPLHGNNIKAVIRNTGDLFWDYREERYKAGFQVPYRGEASPSTIFDANFVMAGIDPDGVINIAYNENQAISGQGTYLVGPLDTVTGLPNPDNCENYNRIWTAYRHEIDFFLKDLTDNGILDHPLENIMGWPAQGNPHFSAIYGFELPNTPQGLAPFFDNNQDGIYNPEDGDYPHPPHVHPEQFPNQMTWSVFNDMGHEGISEPIQAEVQLTTYAFACADNPILSNTMFTNYKVINRSEVALDSFHLGLVLDFNIGCHKDDFIGSIPEWNTFYGYNVDAIDGSPGFDCSSEISTYGFYSPVQAVTILKGSLDYFTYFYYVPFGQPPFPLIDPYSSVEAFNFLTGSGKTGQPFTYGGYGIGEAEVVNHVFPDNPNDSLGWSMLTHHLPSVGFFNIAHGVTAFDSFSPNEVIEMDYAWSFHQGEELDNLQNVNLMYAQIPQLQQMYNHQFKNFCLQPVCEEDCVWAGDTNADGIANHCDLLPIAVGLTLDGPKRFPPYNWSPQFSEDWTQTFPSNSFNYKHIDANGDGIIMREDFEITLAHYNRKRLDYEAQNIYTVGSELYIEAHSNTDIENLQLGDLVDTRIFIDEVPDLYGLAFSMELDTQYLTSPASILGNAADWSHFHIEENQLDYVQSEVDGVATLEAQRLCIVRFWVRNDIDESELPIQTTLRFKNIKANDRNGNPIELGGTDLVLTIKDPSTFISNLGKGEWKVFPNPTRDVIYLEYSGEAASANNIEMELSNVFGQVIRRRIFNGDLYAFDLSDFSKGVYFLKVEDGKNHFVKRIVLR